MMKKITLALLLITGFMWGQTIRVDVSELSNVGNVQLVTNFGGSFDVYPATDQGSGLWGFDMSGSADVSNEYQWLVTFNDTSTLQENLIATVGGQGMDNDVVIGQDINTDFSSYCNRVVTIGAVDPPTTFFNSFRIPGVTYTELTLTAPAPGAGENYYMFYDVNGFSEFGGPGTIDNGDGTYTAIVRPDAAFEYKWVLNNDPGTVGEDLIEDILTCTNDGVTINTDNVNYANRIHAAGENKMDEFSVCPDTGSGELTELIGNGSFETGDFTDWQNFPSSTPTNQTVVDTNASEGVFTANINNITGGTNSLIKSANRGVGIVNPGDEVTIKFDMRGTAVIGGLVFAELLSEFSGGGATGEILSGGPLFPNANPELWTSFEFTTTVGSDVSGGITLQLGAVTSADSGSLANIFFDNVSMVNNDESLSVDSFVFSDSTVKIYPNPTQNVWNVKTNNQNIDTIQVVDIQGRLVLDITPNTNEAVIDASNLPAGLYFARINTPAGTESIKLIKQ